MDARCCVTWFGGCAARGFAGVGVGRIDIAADAVAGGVRARGSDGVGEQKASQRKWI